MVAVVVAIGVLVVVVIVVVIVVVDYNVMDSRESLIRPPKVCAAVLERLTLHVKSSAECYR